MAIDHELKRRHDKRIVMSIYNAWREGTHLHDLIKFRKHTTNNNCCTPTLHFNHVHRVPCPPPPPLSPTPSPRCCSFHCVPPLAVTAAASSRHHHRVRRLLRKKVGMVVWQWPQNGTEDETSRRKRNSTPLCGVNKYPLKPLLNGRFRHLSVLSPSPRRIASDQRDTNDRAGNKRRIGCKTGAT